ncbi:unnamed protein product [Mucor hiemalis]
MVAVRQQDGGALQNEAGETTSHLMGMFYRTVRMVDNGIKPVYVFDGKPPVMKSGELAKRKERKEDAQKKLDEATETGNLEDINRFTKRTVKVTREHNDECKRLLKTMGIPYVEAPCEAEAQCAELAKSGKVFAAASEDMDTLTFKTPRMMRHLTFSEARKLPIDEIDLDKVLEGFGFDMTQFIDLCIMMGCDYTETIRSIGPKTAYNLISKHKTIEEVLKNLTPKQKEGVPENWQFAEARALFTTPEVTPGSEIELNWEAPDVEACIQFMVKEKGFSEDRIRNGCEKLNRELKKATQTRVQDFFKVLPSTSTPKKPVDTKKRNAKDTPKRGGASKRGRR